jgi:hypothetical protein
LYHRLNIKEIPDGSASVPVTVDDNGDVYKARMVAGSVAFRVTSGGEMLPIRRYPIGYDRGANGGIILRYREPPPVPQPGLDSLQPISVWWIYKVDETTEGKKTQEEERMEELMAERMAELQASESPIGNEME